MPASIPELMIVSRAYVGERYAPRLGPRRDDLGLRRRVGVVVDQRTSCSCAPVRDRRNWWVAASASTPEGDRHNYGHARS